MDSDTMQAGREMDALIEEQIFERAVNRASRAWQDGYMHEATYYSTDIAAAWEVVARFVRAGCSVWIEGDGHTGWRAGCTNGHGRFEAEADTAPLAICRAALQAVQP